MFFLKCLRFTLCLVNFIFFICGAAMFGLGIYLMVSYRFSLLPSLPSVSVASGLFITAIIVTCVSFLGFLGALREKRCLLMSYFLLVFSVMLAELAAAGVLLVYETEIDNYINEDLNSGLKNSMSIRVNVSGNPTAADDWDVLQQTFECCGVNSYTDWQSLQTETCCINQTLPCPKNSTGHPNYWPQGCYTKLKEKFENNLLNTGTVVITVCVIEVLGMCFSMTLFCHLSPSTGGYK